MPHSKVGRKKVRSASQGRYRAACGGRGRCYARKVRNLVRHSGFTERDAEKFMAEVYRKRGET